MKCFYIGFWMIYDLRLQQWVSRSWICFQIFIKSRNLLIFLNFTPNNNNFELNLLLLKILYRKDNFLWNQKKHCCIPWIPNCYFLHLTHVSATYVSSSGVYPKQCLVFWFFFHQSFQGFFSWLKYLAKEFLHMISYVQSENSKF